MTTPKIIPITPDCRYVYVGKSLDGLVNVYKQIGEIEEDEGDNADKTGK